MAYKSKSKKTVCFTFISIFKNYAPYHYKKHILMTSLNRKLRGFEFKKIIINSNHSIN